MTNADRVLLDELERLVVEIGGQTAWTELETMIRSTAVNELGRELHSTEEQRLLEAWVGLG
jgi:hypothetical protein